MDDPLTIYLHDHLAGSRMAVDLLGSLREQHAGSSLGEFAVALLVEVEEDQAVLQDILDRSESKSSHPLKDAAAWLGEKGARLKLHHRMKGELGTFQALETLGLGILGKRALWQTLSEAAADDPRLHGVDLDRLSARALAQHARVQERGLEVARGALRDSRQESR